MLRLYDYLSSGNGYKVRLLLTQLGIPFERIELDIMRQETRTPDFLAKNPNGRIPTLELEDGTFLPESTAILFYLAEGTPFLSDDRKTRALTLSWMCFEQYSHEPFIATSRFILMHSDLTDGQRRALDEKRAPGYAALDVMERHLGEHDFFASGRYSIADIALYAYTHVADEGGFELGGYTAIGAWLARVRGQPNHIPITQG